MERLTHYDDDVFVVLNECQNCNPGNNNEACGLCEHQDSANSRLAAYEDTGLTPGEVRKIANVLQEAGQEYNCRFEFVAEVVERHAKYVDAEREGRCVVLPCKVGDTVYDLAFGGYAFEITRIEMHMNNRMWFRCGNKGTDDYMAFSLDDIGERVSFIKPKPQPSIPAEAALKEREQNDN